MQMIELVLNAVWLAVVAGAFAVIPRRSGRATLTLACILVLLFPIISVSDDLALSSNSLEEALAIVVALLILVAGFIAVARAEDELAEPASGRVAMRSDALSPARASSKCTFRGRVVA